MDILTWYDEETHIRSERKISYVEGFVVGYTGLPSTGDKATDYNNAVTYLTEKGIDLDLLKENAELRFEIEEAKKGTSTPSEH